MFSCSWCGSQNVIGRRFCETCGRSFQYDCPDCGRIVDPAWVTCHVCGATLRWSSTDEVLPFTTVKETAHRGLSEKQKKSSSRSRFGSWFGLLLIMVSEFIVFFGFGGYYLIGKIRSLSPNQILSYAQSILAHSGDIMNTFQHLDLYQAYCFFGGIVGAIVFLTGLVLFVQGNRKG